MNQSSCPSIRFWYERDGVFTSEQLVSLKQGSLSSAICDNTDITRVQKDVFLRVDNDDEYLNCDQITRLDLRQWTDCCEGESSRLSCD